MYFSLNVEVRENLNYKEILSKIKKLLNWWKQRDLTIMGKIQLLKLFVFSKFIYVASLTPVPRWVYEDLDQLTFRFLWGGRNKINKSTMYLDYNLGGLKMMKFHLVIKAQRVMWIKRLLDDNEMKWKQYFKYATKHLGGRLIFSCDYLLGLLKVTLPQFYVNLLEIWMDTNDFRIKYEPYKGNEIIFNNKFIRVKGKCIFYDSLFEKNIYKLKHILDQEGNLRSFIHFQQMGLNINDFKTIRTIYEVLPESWKRNMLRNDSNSDNDVEGIAFVLGERIIPMSDIVSKKIYVQFLKKESITPGIFDKLKDQYGFSFKDIENIFKRPRKCTLNSRLREFQFKLLHGIAYTNHHLYRFGFAQTNLCSFCKKEEETYRHIFFECEYAKSVWINCSDFFEFISIRNLDWKEIFFGIQLNDQGKDNLVNHLLILVKYLIFIGREKSKPMTLEKITRKFKEDEIEEKSLALLRNTFSLHLRKWENLD